MGRPKNANVLDFISVSGGHELGRHAVISRAIFSNPKRFWESEISPKIEVRRALKLPLFREFRVHVLLVGFDARLAVGVDVDEAALDGGGQHEHLKHLAHFVGGESRKQDVGGGAIVIGVRLICSGDGGAHDIGN